MQRSFSTFPAGWPGLGLLLLRATVGAAAILQGAFNLKEGIHLNWAAAAVGLLAVAYGVSLLIGLLTPYAGILAGLGGAGVALFSVPTAALNLFDAPLSIIFNTMMAAAVVLLGPGAYSLDARLFGRREIIIPPAPRPPTP